MICLFSNERPLGLRDYARNFVKCEAGAVTVDMMPIMMMAVSMGVAVTGEIANGVKSMSVGIETTLIMGVDPTANGNRQIFGALEGWGGGETIVMASADTGSDTSTFDDNSSDTSTSSETTTSTDNTSSEGDSGGTDTSSGSGGPGNPGNDKAVGNAGETPNGSDDWGSGSNGRSDADGTGSNSNGNSGGNGNNNGNGNGNGKK